MNPLSKHAVLTCSIEALHVFMYKLSQMDAFLVGEDVSGDCESDEDIKVSDLAQEVSCRTILHWNYRGLVSLPLELLSKNFYQTL